MKQIGRRAFVQSGLAGSAAVAAGATGIAQRAQATETIDVGVLFSLTGRAVDHREIAA